MGVKFEDGKVFAERDLDLVTGRDYVRERREDGDLAFCRPQTSTYWYPT